MYLAFERVDMARNQPDFRADLEEWESGRVRFDDGHVDGDLRAYVLARRHKEYDIRWEDDDPEEHVDHYDYQFWQPDQLTVEERDRMADNGWEFVDVTVEEFAYKIHNAFSPDV